MWCLGVAVFFGNDGALSAAGALTGGILWLARGPPVRAPAALVKRYSHTPRKYPLPRDLRYPPDFLKLRNFAKIPGDTKPPILKGPDLCR